MHFKTLDFFKLVKKPSNRFEIEFAQLVDHTSFGISFLE